MLVDETTTENLPTQSCGSMKRVFVRPEPFIRRDDRPGLSSLTLICCCAGYGKTAYLSQLELDHPQSACISLCFGDDIIQLLSEALPEAHIDEGCGPRRAVSLAAGALRQRDGGLLLVDNADAVSSPECGSALRMLAEEAAAGGFTAVFAAESIPAYLLALLTEGRAALWGAERLRFTPEETAVLAERLRPGMTDSAVSGLVSFTGGWCVSVPALLRGGTDDLFAAADSSVLPEYVKGLIADRLDEPLRQRLLQFAFLQGDDSLYRDGLRLSDMRTALFRLNRMGLVLRGEEGFYCPEVLRYLLSQLLPTEQKDALTEQASDYYVRQKRFAEATRLFEVSGNSAAAERLLQLYGDKLLANCEFELIGYCGSIIGGLSGVQSADALGALAQYYYYNGEYAKMEQAFNRADSMFGKENRFSVLRRLYNGLLRYERKPELYTENVRSAVEWLERNGEPLPFLYRREADILSRITAREEKSGDENKLYIRRFGGLRLCAGRERTEIQCKTKRSHELLAYMLLHGEKPVGRDELLDAFWHESMPANAVAMLHNMIYHLRRELSAYGLENIVSYKNKYYTLDTSLIVAEDSEINEVCDAVESNDAPRLLLHEGLLRSYWGSYLGTIDTVWANEKREYYDRCYINACTLLGEHYHANGRYDDALALLKNAYRLDQYSEQLVGEIVRCSAALGHLDQARRCYEEYAARLDEEFGTRPSKWLRNRFFSCFQEEA